MKTLDRVDSSRSSGVSSSSDIDDAACEQSKLLPPESKETKKLPCGDLLESISEDGYNLSWQDLSYHVKMKRWFSKKPPYLSCWNQKTKTILSNLTGFAAAGKINF